MWRCPHCGTPQAETARCWVCRRSSTACGTCRHFRRSVAAQLGYCGLDRKRAPLVGDEIRPCWEAAVGMPAVAEVVPLTTVAGRTPSASVPAPIDDVPATLDFIEVGTEATMAESAPVARKDAAPRIEPDLEAVPAPPADLVVPTPRAAQADPGWSFWAELEG